jgi:hypothetical protein
MDKKLDEEDLDLFEELDDEEDILRGLEEPKYRRRRRSGATQAGPGTIVLTPSTISVPDTTPVGANVATITMSGGWGTYTYTLTDPSGRFTIVGNNIQVASPLTAGFYNVTVNATNGQGDNPSISTTIFVSATTTYVPTYPYYGF